MRHRGRMARRCEPLARSPSCARHRRRRRRSFARRARTPRSPATLRARPRFAIPCSPGVSADPRSSPGGRRRGSRQTLAERAAGERQTSPRGAPEAPGRPPIRRARRGTTRPPPRAVRARRRGLHARGWTTSRVPARRGRVPGNLLGRACPSACARWPLDPSARRGQRPRQEPSVPRLRGRSA